MFRRRLASGAPALIVAALAAAVVAAILYTVASRSESEPRGYGEVTLFRVSCAIESTRRRDVVACKRAGPGAYRVEFARTLDGSVAIATRGSCCPGRIAASIVGERTVLIAVERRVTTPIRASVLVP